MICVLRRADGVGVCRQILFIVFPFGFAWKKMMWIRVAYEVSLLICTAGVLGFGRKEMLWRIFVMAG